jgi:hypothetical protein
MSGLSEPGWYPKFSTDDGRRRDTILKDVGGHTLNGKLTVVLKMQGKSGIYFCLRFNQIPERANNRQHFCFPGLGLSIELCTSSVD